MITICAQQLHSKHLTSTGVRQGKAGWNCQHLGLSAVMWGFLVHSRMLSSIPGLYPLDASSASTPQVVDDDQKSLQALPNVPWKLQSRPGEHPWSRVQWLGRICLILYYMVGDTGAHNTAPASF